VTTELSGKKILLVDDDPVLRRLATAALTSAGGEVDSAGSGEEGLRRFYAGRPDLVILDVQMPGIDGWETLRQIRLLAETPVLMLTGQAGDDDVVRGLELGADDYVAKPCNMRVLVARVQAALRSRGYTDDAGPTPAYADDYLAVDLEKRRVSVRGEPVKLSGKEFAMLAYLVANAGRILSARQILEQVWGWEYRDDLDYVRVYMAHLRGKLEENPKEPRYLITEHGVGYRFEKQA
jgi:two-component system KDP operon response regulator KdpE